MMILLRFPLPPSQHHGSCVLMGQQVPIVKLEIVAATCHLLDFLSLR